MGEGAMGRTKVDSSLRRWTGRVPGGQGEERWVEEPPCWPGGAGGGGEEGGLSSECVPEGGTGHA